MPGVTTDQKHGLQSQLVFILLTRIDSYVLPNFQEA